MRRVQLALAQVGEMLGRVGRSFLHGQVHGVGHDVLRVHLDQDPRRVELGVHAAPGATPVTAASASSVIATPVAATQAAASLCAAAGTSATAAALSSKPAARSASTASSASA